MMLLSHYQTYNNNRPTYRSRQTLMSLNTLMEKIQKEPTLLTLPPFYRRARPAVTTNTLSTVYILHFVEGCSGIKIAV